MAISDSIRTQLWPADVLRAIEAEKAAHPSTEAIDMATVSARMREDPVTFAQIQGIQFIDTNQPSYFSNAVQYGNVTGNQYPNATVTTGSITTSYPVLPSSHPMDTWPVILEALMRAGVIRQDFTDYGMIRPADPVSVAVPPVAPVVLQPRNDSFARLLLEWETEELG